jgi:FAD/FMN-containing dehydrogenase
MNAVHVDVAARRVQVGGGATIGDVDRETRAFDLAVPLGIVSGTSIGGLTLCGGHNWLNRKHGFACDNLVSVDMVTADGQYLTAREAENADLFWVVRNDEKNKRRFSNGIASATIARLRSVRPPFRLPRMPTKRVRRSMPI